MVVRFHPTRNLFLVRGVTESGNAAPPHNCSASPFCTGVNDFCSQWAEQFIFSQKTNPCTSHSRNPLYSKFLNSQNSPYYPTCHSHTPNLPEQPIMWKRNYTGIPGGRHQKVSSFHLCWSFLALQEQGSLQLWKKHQLQNKKRVAVMSLQLWWQPGLWASGCFEFVSNRLQRINVLNCRETQDSAVVWFLGNLC